MPWAVAAAGHWKAQITVPGFAKVYLDQFVRAADAAKAWDRASVLIHGQAAKTNNDIKDYAAELAEFVRRAPAPLLRSCMPASKNKHGLSWPVLMRGMVWGDGVLRSKLTGAL